MSVITGDRGVALLRQAAEPGRHDRQIVNSRKGLHQEWIGLVEAESIVRRSDVVCIREEARTFQLMCETRDGEIFQFEIDLRVAA